MKGEEGGALEVWVTTKGAKEKKSYYISPALTTAEF